MTDINNVVLIGRVTTDVGSNDKSMTYLPNGTAKLTFSIAVNKSQKASDGSYTDYVSFFDIVLFGKMAESLKSYLTKGQQVSVLGSLRQDRWEKDGKRNSKIYITADSIQLLGKKSSTENSSSNNSAGSNDFNPADGFAEDIPF